MGIFHDLKGTKRVKDPLNHSFCKKQQTYLSLIEGGTCGLLFNLALI